MNWKWPLGTLLCSIWGYSDSAFCPTAKWPFGRESVGETTFGEKSYNHVYMHVCVCFMCIHTYTHTRAQTYIYMRSYKDVDGQENFHVYSLPSRNAAKGVSKLFSPLQKFLPRCVCSWRPIPRGVLIL